MKAVKKALQDAGKTEDEVKAFEKRAQGLAKKILGSFKDYEFYTGESMNPEGMVALLNYREVSFVSEHLYCFCLRRPSSLIDCNKLTSLSLSLSRQDGTTPYFTFWKDGLKEG